jgi:hypothetical protein
MAHYRWLLYFYCELHSIYDPDTCASMYAKLPECLDLIEMSLQDTGFSASANAARRAAREACGYLAWGGDTHGVMIEDIRKTVRFLFTFLQTVTICASVPTKASSASHFLPG